MNRKSLLLSALFCGALVTAAGCTAPGENPQQKRDNIQKMKTETLSEFYLDKPEVKQMLTQAPGYAIFKNFEMGFFPGGGSGYGVLVDNATGKQTYMQQGQGSIGIGLTVKDCRTLLVFDDAKVMENFVKENWVSGGSAEAVFTFGEFGGQTNATGYFGNGIRVYELTENGVSLRAWVPFRKYSPYNLLNEPVAAK